MKPTNPSLSSDRSDYITAKQQRQDAHNPLRRRVLRLLDGNLNRAAEGLRVVEDFARFVLDDADIAAKLKAIRHEIGNLAKHYPLADSWQSRDAAGDVGRSNSTGQEYQRVDSWDVATANMKRTQQALRSLEEFSKPYGPELAKALENLRYQTYELETLLQNPRVRRLANARLYVLIDAEADEHVFGEKLLTLVDLGVPVVQLRAMQQDDRTLWNRSCILREITRNSDTLALINDRPDLAEMADLDGVHLGQRDLPPTMVRRMLRPNRLIGLSTHSVTQAEAAIAQSDYIGVGPVFASRTKSFTDLAGLPLIRGTAQLCHPAFAIGGITHENITQVLQAGASRVAVSAAIWHSRDLRTAVSRFQDALQEKEFADDATYQQ